MNDNPQSALKSLDVLVGTWQVSGVDGVRGHVTYEWMQDGRFLIQHVDLADDGEASGKGIEYIRFDAGSGTLRSHYFGQSGEVLEYTYAVEGDTLTIWFGDRTSPAKFTGTFNADFTANSGGWVWPGGGYKSTMVKV